MSKHLRGQRRAAGRPEAANLHKEPVMDANELKLGAAQEAQQQGGAEAQNAAPADKSAPKAPAEQAGSFTAQDLSQPDIGMGAPDLGAAADAASEFPNGDDPDHVPVTPELPDDKVPNMPGAILKHAREMLGLSLREVALRINVRVNTVSDLEHDRLNQQTAVPFATAYLTAYAKLVNVDPDAVVSLYRQNVSRAAAEAAGRPQQGGGRRGLRPLRLLLIVIAIAAVLAAGIVIGVRLAGGSGDQEEAESGALTLSPGAQQQVRQASEEGALEPLGPAADSPAPAAAPAPEALDSNTQMARQQAEDLGTNEIIARAQKPQDDTAGRAQASDGALSVKGAAAEAAVHESLRNAAAAPAPKGQDQAAQQPALSQAPASASQDGGRLALAVPADKKSSKDEVLRSERKDANAPAKKEDAGKDEAQAAPSSLGSVRTVSARVVNRRDIGSLNSVSVRVKGPVYLRIIGNGKVLRQGSFKAGQSVSATGMPPIRIEVSDSSLVSISYNGGTVAAGSGRNVGFDLPTR